jgi:hypothetical protein
MLDALRGEGYDTRNHQPSRDDDSDSARLERLIAKLERERIEREQEQEYTPGAGGALDFRPAGPGALNHSFDEYNS